ncbi:MAG: TetR/AcrR family transcriptional regulator [Actinomycetota bacterium]
MSDAAAHKPSLREAHAQATRDRILDAFADLLTDTHPAEVSVPDVARRAGVGVATVYRHFPKKLDLFDSYASRNADDVLPLDQYDHPADRLRAVARNFALRETHYRVERFGPVIDEIRSRRRTATYAQWDTAIRRSLPDFDDNDRDRLCRTLGGLFTPWTYISLRDDGGLTPEEAVEALVGIVWSVLENAGANEEDLR